MKYNIELNCSRCAWYVEIEIPADRKDLSPRGYCHYNPPAVFPYPQQHKSNLALAQGQQAPGRMQMVPMMMRPVVEAVEEVCGRYQPNREVLEEIEKTKGGCSGCDGENCEC